MAAVAAITQALPAEHRPWPCHSSSNDGQDGTVLPMSYPHADVERGLPTQAPMGGEKVWVLWMEEVADHRVMS